MERKAVKHLPANCRSWCLGKNAFRKYLRITNRFFTQSKLKYIKYILTFVEEQHRPVYITIFYSCNTAIKLYTYFIIYLFLVQIPWLFKFTRWHFLCWFIKMCVSWNTLVPCKMMKSLWYRNALPPSGMHSLCSLWTLQELQNPGQLNTRLSFLPNSFKLSLDSSPKISQQKTS